MASTPSTPTPPQDSTDVSRRPIDGALPAQAIPEVQAAGEQEEPALPPALSGKAFLRKGAIRWAVTGVLRLSYRLWTRIAAHAFPEDSRRAALATSIGIPLPDRLNMSWITPQLAVGGRIIPADVHRLAESGVTRVVDTRIEHRDDEEALAREDIRLLYLPTPDTFPLTIEQLRQGSAWINHQIDDGQRVLVHCEHGVGRSVLLAAASLVARGMAAHDALDLVRRKRWQAAPNHRQMRRLQEFERAVHARASSAS